MSEEKIVNNYYQTNIKTSRNEDSVYAMKYASQQMLIDKLQQENQELKEQLEKRDNVLDEIREYIETHVKEHIHDDYDVTLYNSLNQDECDELLQILDKVKE